MGDHPEEIVGFQFVRKGVELVRESRREIALTAGDVVLWDGLQPTQVEVVEPFVKRTLIFPRERVLAVCPRLADLKALPPMDHNGAAALLVRYLNALAAELPASTRPPAAPPRTPRSNCSGPPSSPRSRRAVTRVGPPCAPRCAATSAPPASQAVGSAAAGAVRAQHPRRRGTWRRGRKGGEAVTWTSSAGSAYPWQQR